MPAVSAAAPKKWSKIQDCLTTDSHSSLLHNPFSSRRGEIQAFSLGKAEDVNLKPCVRLGDHSKRIHWSDGSETLASATAVTFV